MYREGTKNYYYANGNGIHPFDRLQNVVAFVFLLNIKHLQMKGSKNGIVMNEEN